MRDLDLGYNLVKTHDGASAFLVVDHDEEDMISARAPIGNIYAPGEPPCTGTQGRHTLEQSKTFLSGLQGAPCI